MSVASALGQLNTATYDAVAGLKARLDAFENPGRKTYGARHKAHREAFEAWARAPRDLNLQSALTRNQKDVEIASDPSGGFGVPLQLEDQLRALQDTRNVARRLATVVEVDTNDYRAVVVGDETTAAWAAETDARTNATEPDFRQTVPTFGDLHVILRASTWAVEDGLDILGWLSLAAGNAFAKAEITAMISGTGSGQPRGLAANAPVTTDDAASPLRDSQTLKYLPVATGSPLAMSADLLVDLQADLPEEFLAAPDRCTWLMAPSTWAAIRKLAAEMTGDAGWFVGPPQQPGAIATLLGCGVVLAAQMPAATSDALPLLFGDFAGGYLLAERGGTRITADAMSTPGYIDYHLRRRVGGAILNNRAVRAGKFAIA